MQERAESDQIDLEHARALVSPPDLRRPILRVVIFTDGLRYSVCKGIAELIRIFPQIEWLILEQSSRKSIRILLRNQWRNVRKNGWRWLPYQARDIVARVFARILPAPSRPGGVPGAQYSEKTILGHAKVRHLRVPDIHGSEVIDEVRGFDPDLGISLAAPILKASLFDIPRQGTINLHKGRLPDYRGMPPAFWETVNGESEIGCTVHRVERGLDTGPILVQRSVPRSRYSTVRGLQLMLDETGVRLTCEAVEALRDGTPHWRPQDPGGRTYSKPTLRQLAEVEKRAWDPRSGARLRNLCKDAFFWSYIRLARPLARRYLGWRNRQRVIVLLYHRVSDERRDSLTVGIEQFDAQMEWLSRHHPIASIADVVRGAVPRDAKRTVVAVTFDDGYLDNYENAVPVLLRHQVPAAFFVSTGLIGSTAGFPHDWKRLGRSLPTMTWEQIREMYELGFVIGSHSVTHLDCGGTDVEAVRRELIESRDVLKGKLGLDEVIFAYPYGGRANMTPAVLKMVEELGYAGCLSAYGEYNEGRLDRYNIRRVGIDCNFSMLAFRARLEGFC